MTETAAKAPARQIAGFWRRTIALASDALIIGLPAYYAGQYFVDQLIPLGQSGRLIGLAVMLLYFGIGDSALIGGRTIGKTLCGIRVVGASGTPISFIRSLLRTAIFAIPLFLNGIYLPPALFNGETNMWAAGALLFLGVFGFGAASLYLFVFNGHTRQALHDLFVETYVVRGENDSAVEPRIWTGHVMIVLAWFAICLAGPIFLNTYLDRQKQAGDNPYPELTRLQDELGQNPDFDTVSVQTEYTSLYSTKVSRTTTYLKIEVRLKHRVDDPDPIIRSVAAKVLKLSPNIMGMDELSVSVGYGFDLGIARANYDQVESQSADEWRKLLGETKPAGPQI